MGRSLPFLPTCGSPSKTLSFRAATAAATAAEIDDMIAAGDDESSVEAVIRGLSNDRFFFNPGETSSILEEARPKDEDKDKDNDKESVLTFKESVSMMEMESTDPFVDFKKSMQEMVDADEGLKEWDNLQELLSLYLAVNDKINHGYIIRAFVDLLLVNLGSSSKPCSCSSSSSSNGQEQSLLLKESGASSSNRGNNNNNSNNNKLMMMISSESPESGLSFTSSFASSSEICSSTSHFLSSCSLEDDDDDDDDDEDDGDNHGCDEDHNCPQKASVSVYESSSLKV